MHAGAGSSSRSQPTRLPAALNACSDSRGSSVADLFELLHSHDAGVRVEALETLAEMIEGTYGEGGTELGEALRTCGGVPILATLLDDDANPEIPQAALLIIANLCSDSVDAMSCATKAELLACGAARALLACVYAEDAYTLTLACGALQNLTYARDWAEHVVAHGVHAQLEALLSHEEQAIVRYALGALTNVATHLPDHLRIKSTDTLELLRARKALAEREKHIYSEALQVIAAYASAIPPLVREARRTRARQRLAQLVGGQRWEQREERPGSAGSARSGASSEHSSNTCRSYMPANTMSSASHASHAGGSAYAGSAYGGSTYGESARGRDETIRGGSFYEGPDAVVMSASPSSHPPARRGWGPNWGRGVVTGEGRGGASRGSRRGEIPEF